MTITTSIDGEGIAVVTMHHPPVNAITVADTWRIRDVFRDLGHRDDVRAVILTAEGKGFNAGIDIKEMQSAEGFEHLLGSGAACFATFEAIYQCEVPTIAAVNDFCMGLGVGLVGSCDIIVASTKARFGLPEVDNGALGAATHLMRLVPQHRARQMMYMAEMATAAELHAHGSIYKVVPLDQLMDTARECAQVIASKSPIVIRKAKRAFNSIDDDPTKTYRTEQGFTFELNLIGEGDKARDAFLRGER
jgi:enoyl-CoA hydratase